MRFPKLVSAAAVFMVIAFVVGCQTGRTSGGGLEVTLPAEGTHVTTTSEAFRRLADDIRGECNRIRCTCSIDGVQTTCSIVFACLEAGFCRMVATDG